MKICKVEWCNEPHSCNGYCVRHYDQMRMYGKILKRTLRDRNEINLKDGKYLMDIYNRKHEKICETIIDKDKIKLLSKYKWHLRDDGYVQCKVNKKNIKMHQVLMGKKDGLIIDHINRNILDNRIKNLRHATRTINSFNQKKQINNTSGITGVNWSKEKKKWEVRINCRKKCIRLGRFKNKEDAIKVRKEAELKYYGVNL